MSKIIELGAITTLIGLSDEDNRKEALTEVGKGLAPYWLEASVEERAELMKEARGDL